MKKSENVIDAAFTKKQFLLSRSFLLILGTLLFVFSDMRGGSGFIAWFAPVPFLVYVMRYRGWKNALVLFSSLVLASHLAVAKIITPPLSYFFVPMYAFPTAFGFTTIYLLWGFLERRVSSNWAIAIFISLVVLFEWIQSFYSAMGVWGTLAHSQLENLPLLQTASITGMLGISALIAWGAVLFARIVNSGEIKTYGFNIVAFASVMSILHVYGSIRLLQDQPGPGVRIAAVSTDYIISGGLPETDDPDILNTTKTLIERSEKAARMGAEVVVWNEGATFIAKKNEQDFIHQLSDAASESKIHLVAAYVVPVSKTPLQFENKYVWITPEGNIAEEYYKHHPVPGEGSITGTDPLRIVSTKSGKMAGAICYDYDFPRMSLEHARLGAGVVVLPSSDWKGIDPQHTLMTRVRSIEGGISILRSVRASTSMGFDGYGRIRGSLPYYEENDRILIVSLPANRIETFYSKTGDILPYFSIVFLIVTGIRIIRNRED